MKLKLLQSNVGTKFYNVIQNMYSKSEACVKIGDSLTNYFPIKLGVRQGDNLNPTLFKVFINDLPSYSQSCIDAVTLQFKKPDCLMYADDIVIFSSSPVGLQNKLNLLEKCCADWGMKVNIKKTKIIIFNKAGRLIKKRFLFANQEVECISNYKYLGIHFTASGTLLYLSMSYTKKH